MSERALTTRGRAGSVPGVSTPSPLSRARRRIAAFGVAGSLLLAVPAAHAEGPQRLLILGDSIAQGTAGDVTWRSFLWRSLQQAPGGDQVDFIGSSSALFNVALNRQDGNRDYAEPGFDQDHESTWGTTLATVVPLLPSKLAALPQQPTAIVVALGTNDAPAGTAKALGLVRRLITSARTSAPGVDIVLQEPYIPVDPSTARGVNVAYTQSFAAGLASIATELDTPDERVVVAPTVTSFDAATLTWDGHHPNTGGELALARTTATALAEVGVGDGPHLPDSAVWPQAGPRPTVVFGGGRATVTWKDSTPGALAYALEWRRTSPTTGTSTPWTLLTTPPRTTTGWSSPALTVGDVYVWRLRPVRGKMIGQPGPMTGGAVPAPVPAPRRAWWQLW